MSEEQIKKLKAVYNILHLITEGEESPSWHMDLIVASAGTLRDLLLQLGESFVRSGQAKNGEMHSWPESAAEKWEAIK